MKYELTDLRVFQAIAEAENLSVAAAGLYMSPSTVSYRIKNLEHAMGASLFTRVATGMKLTPAGEVLSHHVHEVLRSVERMDGDVSRFSSGLRGNIRLLANSSSLHGFLTPSLGRFLLANPGINIELDERPSESILGAIVGQEYDVGVMAGNADSEAVESCPYASDQLLVVTPVGHPLARRSVVSYEQCLDYEFVCLSRTSSNYAFLAASAHRAGRRITTRLHAPTFEAVISLVAAGVGIGCVPQSVVAISRDRSAVDTVGLRDDWATRQLTMVTGKGDSVPSYVSTFVNFLLEDRAEPIPPLY